MFKDNFSTFETVCVILNDTFFFKKYFSNIRALDSLHESLAHYLKVIPLCGAVRSWLERLPVGIHLLTIRRYRGRYCVGAK